MTYGVAEPAPFIYELVCFSLNNREQSIRFSNLIEMRFFVQNVRHDVKNRRSFGEHKCCSGKVKNKQASRNVLTVRMNCMHRHSTYRLSGHFNRAIHQLCAVTAIAMFQSNAMSSNAMLQYRNRKCSKNTVLHQTKKFHHQ